MSWYIGSLQKNLRRKYRPMSWILYTGQYDMSLVPILRPTASSVHSVLPVFLRTLRFPCRFSSVVPWKTGLSKTCFPSLFWQTRTQRHLLQSRWCDDERILQPKRPAFAIQIEALSDLRGFVILFLQVGRPYNFSKR